MGLLSKLKSLLGMEEESRTAGSGVDVTVEREPSADTEPAATGSAADADDDRGDAVSSDSADADTGTSESTDADTGTSDSADADTGTSESTDADTDDESVAAETTAAASTESLVDEEHAEDPTRAAEPAEAAVSDDDSSGEVSEESDGGEPVSSVKGIGPAYASRLEDAGVATVADLAAADAEELAEQTDLSAKRIGRWIDNAQNQN